MLSKVCEQCQDSYMVDNYRTRSRFCSKDCADTNLRGQHKPALVDLSGRKIGKMTVVCDSGTVDKNGQRLWSCACSCGITKLYVTGQLTSKRRKPVQSCGCIRPVTDNPPIGSNFGELTVIGSGPMKYGREGTWKFRCSCGKEKFISHRAVKNGSVISCGHIGYEHLRVGRVLGLNLLRERQLTPEERAKKKIESYKKTRRKIVDTLTDSYVKDHLRINIPIEQVPKTLIETKREQLRLHRLTRELKQAITEKETSID